MEITIAPAEFRPVSITLETQDELDQLRALFHAFGFVGHQNCGLTQAAQVDRKSVV